MNHISQAHGAVCPVCKSLKNAAGSDFDVGGVQAEADSKDYAIGMIHYY